MSNAERDRIARLLCELRTYVSELQTAPVLENWGGNTLHVVNRLVVPGGEPGCGPSDESAREDLLGRVEQEIARLTSDPIFWQTVTSEPGRATARLAVPGGWLYRETVIADHGDVVAIAFVPDPKAA